MIKATTSPRLTQCFILSMLTKNVHYFSPFCTPAGGAVRLPHCVITVKERGVVSALSISDLQNLVPSCFFIDPFSLVFSLSLSLDLCMADLGESCYFLEK